MYFPTFLTEYDPQIVINISQILVNVSRPECIRKKSARLAGTFSSRASRAARFARKFERA